MHFEWNQIMPWIKIVFLNQELLGEEFKQGTNFLFYEGEDPLGEGVVLEIF